MTIQDLDYYIRKHMSGSKLAYDQLSAAYEVVVFGSRAAGVHRRDSDMDVLLVTPHRDRIRAAGFDVVSLSPEEVDSRFWTGSELAVHVLQYGKWIKGAGDWRKAVHISDRAILRKQRRVIKVAENAYERWPRLHPLFHAKYAMTLRRELQRLDLLQRGVAVKPTPTLDMLWETGQLSSVGLLDLAAGLIHRRPVLDLVSQLIEIPSQATVPGGRITSRVARPE